MCPAKSSVLRTNLRSDVASVPQPGPTCADLPQQFPIKIFIKKLNRLHCWSTLSLTNPRDASFSALRL
jgi:hypothetical protein